MTDFHFEPLAPIAAARPRRPSAFAAANIASPQILAMSTRLVNIRDQIEEGRAILHARDIPGLLSIATEATNLAHRIGALGK